MLPGNKGNGFDSIEWSGHDVGATRKVIMRKVLLKKIWLRVVLTAVLRLGWVRLGSSTVLGFFNSKAFLLMCML